MGGLIVRVVVATARPSNRSAPPARSIAALQTDGILVSDIGRAREVHNKLAHWRSANRSAGFLIGSMGIRSPWASASPAL